MRTRQRVDLATNTHHIGYKATWSGSAWVKSADFYVSQPMDELCIDELHKRVRTRRGSHTFRWKNGGPLNLNKIKVTRTNSKYRTYNSGPYQYVGSQACGVLGANPSLGSFLSSISDLTLNSKGATGIARSKPGRPVMGLGQAIGEARQLPSIPRLMKAIRSLRGLGSEYLNIEFGWKPLLKDIIDLLNYTEKIDKAFKQLKRDNGRVVRRRIVVDKTDTSTATSDTGICGTYPTLHSYLYANVPVAQQFSRTNVVKTGETFWFEGAFRYWIPDIEDPWRARVARLHLAGLVPTPALVWELLPWSWLIDWFSNVGDVISNLSLNAANDLVLLYGYSMGHTWTENSWYAQSKMYNFDTVYTSVHVRKDQKRRVKASPFGFGLDFPDFTVRQTAILAALGLSRTRGLG